MRDACLCHCPVARPNEREDEGQSGKDVALGAWSPSYPQGQRYQHLSAPQEDRQRRKTMKNEGSMGRGGGGEKGKEEHNARLLTLLNRGQSMSVRCAVRRRRPLRRPGGCSRVLRQARLEPRKVLVRRREDGERGEKEDGGWCHAGSAARGGKRGVHVASMKKVQDRDEGLREGSEYEWRRGKTSLFLQSVSLQLRPNRQRAPVSRPETSKWAWYRSIVYGGAQRTAPPSEGKQREKNDPIRTNHDTIPELVVVVVVVAGSPTASHRGPKMEVGNKKSSGCASAAAENKPNCTRRLVRKKERLAQLSLGIRMFELTDEIQIGGGRRGVGDPYSQDVSWT
ncbi:hypothetical protein C8R46DRAFT_1040560 [Mycena filopes]|nr:hypothetical protein C8R46DRAFT_1040560 [Mycena filopes]